MRRNYALAFLLVMIVACAGAALGLRLAINSLPRGANINPRPGWTPLVAANATATADSGGVPPSPTPFRVIEPTVPGRPSPALPPSATATPAASPGATGTATATATVTPTESATATSTPDTVYMFVLQGEVRHTPIGPDCGGDSVRGIVYDHFGNPIPGVRLWLVDEYGNEAFADSKREQVDLGHYDFPIFGPPRKFYVTILNDAGHPDSPRIEVVHKRPPNEAYSCHFVDWQRTR